MNTRVVAVMAAIFAGIVLIVIAISVGRSLPAANSVGTSELPQGSADASAPRATGLSPLPVDPCHVGGVTYCMLNPDVTQATIATTICVSGWTASVRPPSSYTSLLKVEQLAALGYVDQNPRDYEEDHRVPLELGGAPRDTMNLSPERGASPNPKDAAENAARADVCAGRSTLRQEQVTFIAAWLAPSPAYRQ